MRRIALALSVPFFAVLSAAAAEPKLVAHWPLAESARDSAGESHGEGKNLEFRDEGRRGARFNGRDSLITVPHAAALELGERDFTLALWVKCETPMTNTLGDLVSKFDPDRRRGLNFHLAGSAPSYNGMSDTRHVHFGIDDGYLGEWDDRGKPWPSNSLISCLVVMDGELYAGIADADKTEDKAKVFRYAGGQEWVDCGRIGNDPDHHSIQSMIVHQGKLYAGSGIWNWEQALGGVKGLPPAAPTRVFVYEGGATWRDLGQVGTGSRVLAMGSFNGELYAGIDRHGKGHAFKYDEANEAWIDCGSPDGRNFECFLPVGGKLYASTHGNVYEYEGGQNWRMIGNDPHQINQIHSMHVFGGKILLGTWPQGYALRYAGGMDWDIMGRLGLPEGTRLCNEINALSVYNGKLYAGVIPKAEFYRYEKDGDWTLLGHLAERKDWEVNNYPTWLRLTCLTSFQGRLWGCTGSCQGRALDAPVDESLGRVYSLQAGQVVSHERDIGGEWTHLAGVRDGRKLKLFVNGRLAATSDLRDGPAFDLDNDRPLVIGFGAQNYFTGSLSDVRLYDGALNEPEVAALAR
jgi:hypothetical protein